MGNGKVSFRVSMVFKVAVLMPSDDILGIRLISNSQGRDMLRHGASLAGVVVGELPKRHTAR